MHASHRPGWGQPAERDETLVADQFRHPALAGPATTSAGVPTCRTSRPVQHGEPVGEGLRGRQLVRHQHGRHLPGRDQLTDQGGEVTPQGGVQAGVRLVEEQRVAMG